MKIVHVAGARPNFIKVASIIKACNNTPGIESLLVHTGQHYSPNMSGLFFDELGIPQPDINLEVGSGSHAQQTAEIMKRFEPVLLEHKPDAVLVVGDVNSTVACTIVAAKLGIKTIHVEAGLRSFDREMPEELNRLLTDVISDVLFVSEPSGLENLKNEGIDESKIHYVGNVMIDTLEHNRSKAEKSDILEKLGLDSGGYAVVTMHRPSNVDDHAVFSGILDAFKEIQAEIPIIFPMHPRTYNNLSSNGFGDRMKNMNNLKTIEPLGYLDFLKLMSESQVVITDSGGMQEETTILGVPCLTIRENTERPVTITEGTNRLVGTATDDILNAYRDSKSLSQNAQRPKYWDGKAAERIAKKLLELF